MVTDGTRARRRRRRPAADRGRGGRRRSGSSARRTRAPPPLIRATLRTRSSRSRPSGGGTAPVSCTIGQGGSRVSAAASPLSDRAQDSPTTSPGLMMSISAWPAASPIRRAARLVLVGEIERKGILEPERRAQLGGEPDVEAAAGQPDLDADHPGLARGVEQPGHPEPADAELVGDVDLGHALQVVLPRHAGGEHDLRGPVGRQPSHDPPVTALRLVRRSFERPGSYFQLNLDFAQRRINVFVSASHMKRYRSDERGRLPARQVTWMTDATMARRRDVGLMADGTPRPRSAAGPSWPAARAARRWP